MASLGKNHLMPLSLSLSWLVTLWTVSRFRGALSFQPVYALFRNDIRRTKLVTMRSSSIDDQVEIHPAVAGWPEKYAGDSGPRVLHQEFKVEKATQSLMRELDVENWPTWSTADKPKWEVGKQNAAKVMPYGELSYVLSGKLEIVPVGASDPAIVEVGDFVTFPEGFQSDWRVLEELTWHYYLY